MHHILLVYYPNFILFLNQIAHMTKAEMEYLDWSLLGPALLFLNQYFNCVVPEIWLLWFTLIWGTQDLVRYCSQVSQNNKYLFESPPFALISFFFLLGLLGNLRPFEYTTFHHTLSPQRC